MFVWTKIPKVPTEELIFFSLILNFDVVDDFFDISGLILSNLYEENSKEP